MKSLFRPRFTQKIGPFNINFTRRGIGWSVGSKAFRWGKTASGRTFATAAGHGYRLFKFFGGGKHR